MTEQTMTTAAAVGATVIVCHAAIRGADAAADEHADRFLIGLQLADLDFPLDLVRDGVIHGTATFACLRLVGAHVDDDFAGLQDEFAHRAGALLRLGLDPAHVDDGFAGLRDEFAHRAGALLRLGLDPAHVDDDFAGLRNQFAHRASALHGLRFADDA